MNNKMVEVKESFWDKFKNFFRKIFLRNKNAFTNQEQRITEELDKSYYSDGKIEEDKLKTIENLINQNSELSDQEDKDINGSNGENKFEVDRENGFVRSETQDEEERKIIKSKYQKTMVNDKEVRCREINDGDTKGKRYVVVGEKECVHTWENGIDTKKIIVYGYDEKPLYLKGMNFTEKVRNKNLDFELSKTTQDGVTEEVRRGPLLDSEDERYKGRYEYKDTSLENGNRLVEWTKEVIDDDGNKQKIYETYSHTKNGYIHTKYLNGQVVFQLVKNEEGTVIKEYDDKGNVKNAYEYDKDGKPTETVFVYGEDGKTRRKPKTYKGLEQIPDDTIQFDKNGVLKVSKEYSEYSRILDRAGLPDELNEILENTYEEHASSFEMEDFKKAKEQLNSREYKERENRQVEEQSEL